MAETLIKYETIDAKQIQEIMSGKPPSPPDGWTSLKDNDVSHAAAKDNSASITASIDTVVPPVTPDKTVEG